jgi:hypothetical protein
MDRTRPASALNRYAEAMAWPGSSWSASTAGDPEMSVESVVRVVPLRDPDVERRLTAEPLAEVPEEPAQVFSQLSRIVASGTGVGERPESVESIAAE